MFCTKCTDFWQTALSKAEVPPTLSSCQDIHWAPHDVVLHHCMRELKASSDQKCILCRCIFSAPTKWELEKLMENEDERLGIVLEIDPTRGPHPVILASFMEPMDGGERKARLSKQTLAACGGLLDDEDLSSTLDRTMVLDNGSTGSDAAMELASFWLNRCLSTHEKCRVRTPPGELPFIPTRVVDVGSNDHEIRLVETANLQGPDADRRFVALSHCWGKIHIITTRDENYQEHLKRIDASLLSKTFRDAVHTTRKLGYRHLWIDSLCIIQHNAQDWEVEAATMCDVYRYAAFTIAAAHAPGGDVGCFEERDGTIQFPFFIDIPNTRASAGETAKNQRIMFSSYGRVKPLTTEPPLYGRAWVLQEQLLSPRMMIFDGSQLRWECLCMHGSDRSPTGGMSRHIGHQKEIRMGVMDDVDFFERTGGVDYDNPENIGRAQHQAWCYAVMDYTHRGMTAMSDRVVALDGIAQAIIRTTKDQYVAGLWKNHLWCGLLWSIPHRKEFTAVMENAFDLEAFPHSRHKTPLAPSWSWASVTVPVVFPQKLVFFHRISEVLDVKVTGTPAKKEGAVQIRGHIRKGYVNSIYPYAIREAVDAYPSMAYLKSSGETGEFFTWRDRSFFPNDYFLFSPTKPSGKNDLESSDWRMVRGQWRPDQILDPTTEITFITMAQQNQGTKEGKLMPTYTDQDPLHTYTIGLVPTGRVEGEYMRVGYAEWEDCSWYGYMCGHKSRPGRDIEKAEGLRGLFSRDLGYGSKPKGGHEHKFEPGVLMDFGGYHKDVEAREVTVTIV